MALFAIPAPKETEVYYICSDESSHNIGRFRSISAISLPAKKAKIMHNELKEIIQKNNIEEFKWSKLNGDSRYTKCANSLIDWVYNNLSDIRIDTIIWDILDSRHCIECRDDDKNLAIMYYQVLNHKMRMLPSHICFEIFPDEKDGFDWKTLENCLTAKHNICYDGAFEKTEKGIKIDFSKIRESIINTTPLDSKESVFNQITDLFAGLSAFSYSNYAKYKQWECTNSPQIPLFAIQEFSFSKSEEARFKLLSNFCVSRKISLNSKKGLCTFKPTDVINFWFYNPQTNRDKAPIKEVNYANN